MFKFKFKEMPYSSPVQFMIKSWLNYGQIIVKSWSNYGQVTVKSQSNQDQIKIKSRWSNHSQIMVKSRSNHGQIMVKSWSNHGQIMVKSWSNHDEIMVKSDLLKKFLALSNRLWTWFQTYEVVQQLQEVLEQGLQMVQLFWWTQQYQTLPLVKGYSF